MALWAAQGWLVAAVLVLLVCALPASAQPDAAHTAVFRRPFSSAAAREELAARFGAVYAQAVEETHAVARATTAAPPAPRPQPDAQAEETCLTWLEGLATRNSSADLQMLAASGTYPNSWGNYDACAGVKDAHACAITFSTTEFVAVCVPEYCSREEMETDAIYQFVVKAMAHISFEATVTNVTCFQMNPEPLRATGSIVTTAWYGLFALVALGSVLGHIAVTRWRPVLTLWRGSYTPTNDLFMDESSPLVMTSPRDKPLRRRVFEAVSLLENLPKFFRPSPVGPGLRCLDAIRVLSMCWVILGHTYLELAGMLDGSSLLYVFRTVYPSLRFQVILNGTFAVDTFFYLSGFLSVYHILRHFNRHGMPTGLSFVKWFLSLLSHRYLRLTPLYALTVAFWVYLLPLLGSGPAWESWQTDDGWGVCFKYWWTNMLYVNNFYPNQLGKHATGGLGCMGWSWYLANDFQLFLMSPFVAAALYCHRQLGYALVALLVAACVAVNGTLTHTEDLRVCEADQTSQAPGNYQTLVYNKFYARATPYLVGMALAAYFLDHGGDKQGRKHRASWGVRAAVLLVSGVCLSAPVLGTYGMRKVDGPEQGACDWSEAENLAYLTLSRLAWSVGLTGLVAACLFEWVEPLVHLLGAHVWTPLSRLVYAAYLTHIFVFTVIIFNWSGQVQYSDTLVLSVFGGALLLTTAWAFCLHVCIEAPLLALTKLLLPKAR